MTAPGGLPGSYAASAAGDSDLRHLLHALETAVLGAPTPLPDNGPLSNPLTASAFVPGSVFEPVGLGEGLWGVARASGDGANRVLCVHNPTDHPITFTPDGHLGNRTDQLMFLHGAAWTEADTGQTVCRIGARSFVWLARFAGLTDSSGEPR